MKRLGNQKWFEKADKEEIKDDILEKSTPGIGLSMRKNLLIGLLTTILALVFLKDCSSNYNTTTVVNPINLDSLKATMRPICIVKDSIVYVDRIIKEFVPVPYPVDAEIIYKDRIEYVYKEVIRDSIVYITNLIERPIYNTTFDTIEGIKNRLYLYAAHSGFALSNEGHWLSCQHTQVGLDYTIKKNWIIGASVSHIKTLDMYYGNLKVGFRIF